MHILHQLTLAMIIKMSITSNPLFKSASIKRGKELTPTKIVNFMTTLFWRVSKRLIGLKKLSLSTRNLHLMAVQSHEASYPTPRPSTPTPLVVTRSIKKCIKSDIRALLVIHQRSTALVTVLILPRLRTTSSSSRLQKSPF